MTETCGWNNDVASGVPKASLPREYGIKKGTLAIPSRLAQFVVGLLPRSG